jgi:hypothetical protein
MIGPRRIGLASVGLVIVAGFVGTFLLGRATAPIHDRGWAKGNAVGYDEGVATGRALQVGDTLPQAARDVGVREFQAGYRAGIADIFSTYDGGWKFDRPYVITLAPGAGGAAYRFAGRDELVAGMTYRLCPDGKTVCH